MTVRELHGDDWGASPLVDVYPETLRLLRERKGLRKGELAKRLGKSPAYLTRMEGSGKPVLRVSIQERADYALALRVPPLTLSHTFIEAQPEGVHFHTRKLSAEKRRQAIACAGLTANHVNTLMRILDAPAQADVPQIDVYGMAAQDAGVYAAQQVRDVWGLGDGPISDLAAVLESHGIFITEMRDAVEGVRGMTIMLDPSSAPVVFLAPYINDDTRRQTLAHELGHLVMDHASGLLSDKEIEERATAFGGELLAPWQSVKDDVEGLTPSKMAQLTHLQRRWGAHPAAFIQRGYIHGVFSENQRRNWFVHLNQKKSIVDNAPCSYPVTPTAIRTLMENVAMLGWSEPALSDTLGLRPEELAEALDGWPFPAAA